MMRMGKMECHVIEDLLPSYADDICSPETKQEVEEHLQECEACRARLEQMRQDDEGDGSGVPVGIQDIRPFRKISRKMKRSRAVKVTALLLLLIVCSVFGVLTAGQIFPGLDCPSYDSLMYRFRAKEIARKIVAGDEDEIREALTGVGNDFGSKLTDDERNELINDVAVHLAQNRTAFGGADAAIDVDEVSYCVEEYDSAEEEEPQTFGMKYAYYLVKLNVQCADKEIYMDIGFYNRNQYTIHMRTGEFGRDFVTEGMDENSLEYQVIDINKYLDYYLFSCFGQRVETRLLNARISNQNAETLKENNVFDGAWYTYYLTEDCMRPGVEQEGVYCTEYSRRTAERLYPIVAGCRSNRFQMTDMRYNEAEEKFDATLYWEITDLNGNQCIMTKAFYFGPFGYEPADDSETIFADEGFDREMVQKLESVFD